MSLCTVCTKIKEIREKKDISMSSQLDKLYKEAVANRKRVASIPGRWIDPHEQYPDMYVEDESDNDLWPQGAKTFEPDWDDPSTEKYWNTLEEHLPWAHPNGEWGVTGVSRGTSFPVERQNAGSGEAAQQAAINWIHEQTHHNQNQE